jgi:hypothetical protein
LEKFPSSSSSSSPSSSSSSSSPIIDSSLSHDLHPETDSDFEGNNNSGNNRPVNV